MDPKRPKSTTPKAKVAPPIIPIIKAFLSLSYYFFSILLALSHSTSVKNKQRAAHGLRSDLTFSLNHPTLTDSPQITSMPTLQKFKRLAPQCAVVAGSPSRSPTASPVIHLRRRKTLRMFLSRRLPRSSDSPLSDDDRGNDNPPEKTKEAHRVRRKLKDLFVSSPPPLERGGREVGDGEERGLLSATDGGGVGGLARTRRGGGGVLSRPLTASFRCRLLRRAWRPVLVPIPE